MLLVILLLDEVDLSVPPLFSCAEATYGSSISLVSTFCTELLSLL